MADASVKPDFLAIGPEKTGTTLLYALLNENPQVSLPPCKEIRYWNEGNLIPPHSLSTLLTSTHWHYKELRSRLLKSTFQSIRDSLHFRRKHTSNFMWNLRYCVGDRNSTWYDSLFPRDGNVTGDISPLYYHIPGSVITECSKHNPDMKVIIFVRDPIERVWSKARMVLLKHKGMTAVDFDVNEFRDFFQRAYNNWIPYIDTIELWRAHFPRVHIALYDELLCDSREWYRKICDFLEIEVNDSYYLNKRVNKGVSLEIPNDCERILFQQYFSELKYVGELYNLTSWLERFEQLSARFGTPTNDD